MMIDSSREVGRREFLKGVSTIGLGLGLSRSSLPAQEKPNRIVVGGFTKNLQDLAFEELATKSVEIGWEGIEFPVRPKGHILPNNVKEQLPEACEALRSNGIEILLLATNIHSPAEEETESILRTASSLGIRMYRLGYFKYNLQESLDPQIDEIRSQLMDLADLNRELEMCGVIQNHSGANFFGAPLWDAYEAIKEIDPKWLGIHFDIGHALVEGGKSWALNFHRVKDHVRALAVKDPVWKKTTSGSWKSEWVSLGEGMIDPNFFQMVRESGFSGPATIHYEYDVGGSTPEEKRMNLLRTMKADSDQLKAWVG